MAEHQAKGLEEQALEADVARKTKAAKKRAAKRPQAGDGGKGKTRGAPRRGGEYLGCRFVRGSWAGRRKAVESEEDEPDDDDE